MKSKILMAACTTLVCASAAHAQSSVQVTGEIDIFAGSTKWAGQPGRKSVVDGGGMGTSWFGFKGSEDLGNGLKASFNLTSFITPDNGLQGRFAGDTFFSRDANVSLSGGFGAIQLGRGLAPNYVPTVLVNPFAGSFQFSPLILQMNVPSPSVAGFNGAWKPTIAADTGWSNEIVYSTPNIGGLTANLHYQFGEQTGSNSNKKNVGINAMYFGGPLTLSGFFERAQVANPTGGYLGYTKDAWMLGGAYDFKIVKLYASYGQNKFKQTNDDAKTAQVGVNVPVNSVSRVLASYAQTNVSTPDISRKTFTTGYEYDLSKRTHLYGMVMNDRVTNLTSGTSFGLGMRHAF